MKSQHWPCAIEVERGWTFDERKAQDTLIEPDGVGHRSAQKRHVIQREQGQGLEAAHFLDLHLLNFRAPSPTNRLPLRRWFSLARIDRLSASAKAPLYTAAAWVDLKQTKQMAYWFGHFGNVQLYLRVCVGGDESEWQEISWQILRNTSIGGKDTQPEAYVPKPNCIDLTENPVIGSCIREFVARVISAHCSH